MRKDAGIKKMKLKVSLCIFLIALVGTIGDSLQPREEQNDGNITELKLRIKNRSRKPVPGIKVELFKRTGGYMPIKLEEAETGSDGEVVFKLGQAVANLEGYSVQLKNDDYNHLGNYRVPKYLSSIWEIEIHKKKKKEIFAQGHGEVIGTVVLEDGSAIPGLAVEATSTNLIGKRTSVTGDNGTYRFLGLPSGTYLFTFYLEGFKTTKRSSIKVVSGHTYKLDVVMETGTLREEVVVTGASPVIDVSKNAYTQYITKETFDKLPKGRNFKSIISVEGASTSENTFYVDGVNTTTSYEGKAGTDVNFDFIEEIQVKSSGYAAEYGGSRGGVISVITRSGGNEYHAQLVAYFDGSILGYNPRPTLRINPLNNDAAEYVTYPEDDWTRIEPSFSLGGYIVKDKLWFLAKFVPKFTTTKRNGDKWPVPGRTIFVGDTHTSGSNEFTRKDIHYTASLKLTGQLSSNLRLSISGTLDFSKWEGELPSQDGDGNPRKDYDIYGYKDPKFTVAGSLDYTVGNNLMMNASVGFFKGDHKQMVGPQGPSYFHPRTNVNVPGVVDIVPRYWGNYGYRDGFQTSKQLQDKLTVTFDITCYANMGGEHMFKTGVQMVRVHTDKDDAYPYDYNMFYWDDDYESPNLGTVPTTLGYIQVREPFGTVVEAQSSRWAFYAQDSWTIGDKLTLNFGFRFEKEYIPPFAESDTSSIHLGFGDKFSPRLGFAYDVFGDSSLKVFGSFGIYYNVMKLEIAEGSSGGFKWLSHYYDLVNPDWKNAYPETNHPQTGGLASGQYFETLNYRIIPLNAIQPDIKPYQKNEFTFGVQKTLGEYWTINARFLHNYIVNAIDDFGVQTPHGVEYFIGNPGSDWVQAKYNEAQAVGNMPLGVKVSKAVRKYSSVTVSLDRKFKDNWLGGLSFTWVRLWGDYEGLSISDEQGRKDPIVGRYFDRWFMTYNQDGKNDLGPLATDRPWQFKIYGAYTFDWGLTLGFNAYAMAGTPTQTEIYLNGMQDYYPLGRNSDSRTDMLWQIDLYAEYNLKLSEKYTLNFNVNITNLTNNKIAQKRFMLYNDAVVYMDEQDIFNGFNYVEVIASKGAHLDPRYKMDHSYLDSISARIGVKFSF